MEEKKLYNAVRKIITLADGRQIEIETGKLAKQADGSVVVKQGDTMLLALGTFVRPLWILWQVRRSFYYVIWLLINLLYSRKWVRLRHIIPDHPSYMNRIR